MAGNFHEEGTRDVFPFFELPLEMRRMIIDYVDSPTFATLLRTCKPMKKMLDGGKWVFYRKVVSLHQHTTHFEVCRDGPNDLVPFDAVNSRHWKLHADKLIIENALGEVGLIALLNFVAMHKIHSDMMEIASDVQVTGQNLAFLCELLRARTWLSNTFIPKQILLPVGKVLSELFVVESDCDDDTLLGMTNVSEFSMMRANNITNVGINRLIKQWASGERNIKSLLFERDVHIGNVDDLLEGLPVSVIWTEDDHEDSLLGHLPLDLIQERMQTAGMESLYSLCSSRDVSDYRVLRVGQFRISFDKEDEAEILQRIEEEL